MQNYIEPDVRYGSELADYARQFRAIAIEIDEDPQKIKRYTNLSSIDFLISDRESSALDRTQYLEAFSYGDPGVLLASPGPSLSGLMLRELGLSEQIDSFYQMIREKKMRTFFALTEPDKGSDANHIQTRLVKKNESQDNFFLQGTKAFFGNGAVGEMGIVLARLSDSPVGIRAIWLTPNLIDNSVESSVLPMFCLRGSQISVMKFNHTTIPQENILGHHRSACENGLLSIIKVFNKLRTGVGALAIGQAQAVYDLCYQINQLNAVSQKSIFTQLNMMLVSARSQLHNAAVHVEECPYDSYSVSISKINATRTAEQVIETCFSLIPFSLLIENPWIAKAMRDVYCWEYMEGTTEMQKKQIKLSRGIYE